VIPPMFSITKAVGIFHKDGGNLTNVEKRLESAREVSFNKKDIVKLVLHL